MISGILCLTSFIVEVLFYVTYQSDLPNGIKEKTEYKGKNGKLQSSVEVKTSNIKLVINYLISILYNMYIHWQADMAEVAVRY